MNPTGRVHSFESCGTVDGPGIRFVVFMQGCPLRCLYCHNPDSWEEQGGYEYSVEQIMHKVRRYKPYFETSGGGITVSGGEPGLQPEFVASLFKRCKQEEIHTVLDTSGAVHPEALNSILPWTDLVILDLKQADSHQHQRLTGVSNKNTLAFAQHLNSSHVPFWIRHVLVPGYTDGEEELKQLAYLLTKLDRVEKIEILPYHQLGLHKWSALGIPNQLGHVSPPLPKQIEAARQLLHSITGKNIN